MTFQNEKTSSKAWCLIYRYRRKRRRQKGGFFSTGALAAPILGTLGGLVIKNY